MNKTADVILVTIFDCEEIWLKANWLADNCWWFGVANWHVLRKYHDRWHRKRSSCFYRYYDPSIIHGCFYTYDGCRRTFV